MPRPGRSAGPGTGRAAGAGPVRRGARRSCGQRSTVLPRRRGPCPPLAAAVRPGRRRGEGRRLRRGAARREAVGQPPCRAGRRPSGVCSSAVRLLWKGSEARSGGGWAGAAVSPSGRGEGRCCCCWSGKPRWWRHRVAAGRRLTPFCGAAVRAALGEGLQLPLPRGVRWLRGRHGRLSSGFVAGERAGGLRSSSVAMPCASGSSLGYAVHRRWRRGRVPTVVYVPGAEQPLCGVGGHRRELE